MECYGTKCVLDPHLLQESMTLTYSKGRISAMPEIRADLFLAISKTGVQLKESFQHYKRLKASKRKDRNTRYYASRSSQSQNKQTSQNHDAVRQRNYRLKRQQIKDRQREYLFKYREKQKNTKTVEPKDFQNRTQKARAMKKLKESLPQTPGRRVSVIKSYLGNMRSPTVSTLQNMKIVTSPEEIENDRVTDSVLGDIKSIIQSTKKQRSKDSVLARQLIFASVSGENIQENKQKKKLAKKLGVKRGNLTIGHKIRTHIMKSESSCWNLTKKKNRNNNIPDNHKQMAYKFWLSSGISRPTGNKKDIKRERLAKHTYVSHMIHVLEKSQTEVYSDFRSAHPEIKMSQRSFERLKPFFVRPVRSGDRNTCLCRYHVELKTVFDACMKHRKALLERKNDLVLSTQFPVYKNANEAVSTTLCEKDETAEHHNISCLKRECSECGVAQFKMMDEEEGDEIVDWERFEYVTVSSKGSQVRKKLMLVKKTTPVKELFSYFTHLMSAFPAHQFRATWQREQLKYLTTNLQLNDCAIVHDFSENYRIAGKDELQSSYFARTEVTIHISIIYRHAILEVDGVDSTEENPHIITEQFIVFSNDEKHDHHFVHKVQEMIHDHLTSISYPVNVMHEFTDGCQGQYKSRHCMGDVGYGCGDFGYHQVIRNYFETSHAKGPQDAAGGFIKRQMDLAILRGKVTINTAEDTYQYARDNLAVTCSMSTSARRIFRFIDTSDIDRNRNRYFKPIPNNRDVHQIITCKDGLLTLRSLSCYTCSACVDGTFEECQNKELSIPRDITLEHIPPKAADCDNNIEMPFSVAESVKIGDLVVVYTDENEYDYYLLKATSVLCQLDANEQDSWNNVFPKHADVIRGLYYEKRESMRYKLIPKKTALISSNSVLCVLTEVKAKMNIEIPETLHESLLSWAEECSN